MADSAYMEPTPSIVYTPVSSERGDPQGSQGAKSLHYRAPFPAVGCLGPLPSKGGTVNPLGGSLSTAFFLVCLDGVRLRIEAMSSEYASVWTGRHSAREGNNQTVLFLFYWGIGGPIALVEAHTQRRCLCARIIGLHANMESRWLRWVASSCPPRLNVGGPCPGWARDPSGGRSAIIVLNFPFSVLSHFQHPCPVSIGFSSSNFPLISQSFQLSPPRLSFGWVGSWEHGALYHHLPGRPWSDIPESWTSS